MMLRSEMRLHNYLRLFFGRYFGGIRVTHGALLLLGLHITRRLGDNWHLKHIYQRPVLTPQKDKKIFVVIVIVLKFDFQRFPIRLSHETNSSTKSENNITLNLV